MLCLGVVSDIFDGVLARRWGGATEWIRRVDSFVDRIFYGFVGLVILLDYFPTIQTWLFLIVLLLISELIRFVVDFWKFGRQAAYHMWLAKLWGVSLLLGFSEIFLTGSGGLLFSLSLVLGIISNIEGLWASLILPQWCHDVPSIYHAYQLRQQHIQEQAIKVL